ncbi:hypothetical protein QBC35DRAFT_62506 [Podospora australis]|uniref:Uncharacterized protein n=1 Tax=Podospora australis TaxID=1536484 RepID=A0AAN6WYJ8_9PEZI|nr:hypothetical protein QBC35DRAFT_62506 [Podospora australis]
MGNTCSAPGKSGFECNYSIKGFPAETLQDFTTNSTSSNTTAAFELEELGDIEADPDIAGIGVFVAVMLAFWVSTVVAFAVHMYEWREIRSTKKGGKAYVIPPRSWRNRIHYILDKNLVAWSDQQIALGLATSIATLCVCWCSISTYHFNLAKQWLVLCTITHVNAILVHCDYFNPKNWVANLIRGLLYITHIILCCVVFFDKQENVLSKGWAPTIGNQTPLQMLPAACFFTNATRPESLKEVTGWGASGASSGVIFIISLILVVIGLGILGYDYWQSKRKGWRSWGIRSALLAVNIGSGFYASFITGSTRTWMRWYLEDDSENKLSYGQFVPIFLAFFVFVAFGESICGKSGPHS